MQTDPEAAVVTFMNKVDRAGSDGVVAGSEKPREDNPAARMNVDSMDSEELSMELLLAWRGPGRITLQPG